MKAVLSMMHSVPNDSVRVLVDLAYQEDLKGGIDATSDLLISPESRGAALIVARDSGVVCGVELISVIIERFSADISVSESIKDGTPVEPGDVAAKLKGKTIDLLKIERTVLNFLGRLSGVSSLTHEFVQATENTNAKIYDTRKTTPGWRALEKYAVACGGGVNHRMGLFDAVLIKDNHLAAIGSKEENSEEWIDRLETAFRRVREQNPGMIVQIEVDTLDQFKQVLPLAPDIILLDNMSVEEMSQAVSLRGDLKVELEASGGVNLNTVAAIASSGVDRISVGALTHSAVNFDWGLDWS